MIRLLARSGAALAAALLLLAPTIAAAQAPKPLLDKVQELGGYTTLLKLLEATGLAEPLRGAQPHTLYAPSDAAFERIPADTLAALTADPARLKRVLGHHVLPGRFTGTDMMNTPIYGKVPTVAGDSMVVYHDKGGIKVDLSLVKTVDIEASNGVIHTVHKVILVP